MGEKETEERITRDLKALQTYTNQVPPLAQKGQGRELFPGGLLMDTVDQVEQTKNRRRALRQKGLGGLFAFALATGILFLPISYQKKVGHTVSMQFRTAPPPNEVRSLARKVKAALNAESLALQMENDSLTLRAKVTGRSTQEVTRRANALKQGLAAQKIDTTMEIQERTEIQHARLYAMALDKIIAIRVELGTKTDREIEEEIRAQLEREGISDPKVSFQRKDGETQVQVEATLPSGEGAERAEKQVHILRKTKGAEGVLQFNIGDIDDRREPGMTDAQLKEKIENQLRARGLTPMVTVSGDRIEIRATKEHSAHKERAD